RAGAHEPEVVEAVRRGEWDGIDRAVHTVPRVTRAVESLHAGCHRGVDRPAAAEGTGALHLIPALDRAAHFPEVVIAPQRGHQQVRRELLEHRAGAAV